MYFVSVFETILGCHIGLGKYACVNGQNLVGRQWKNVLWSGDSTFQLVFIKNRHEDCHAEDEKDSWL